MFGSELVRGLTVVVVLACAGLFGSCGDGDASGTQEAGQGHPVPLRIFTEDVSEDEVTLRAAKSVPGGLVRISLTNRGDMVHDAQLFRIDGRHTAEQLVDEWIETVDSAQKPPWAHPAGGVAPVEPGETRAVLQVLEPGRYVVADTQERDKGPGGKLTNAAKGGITVFEVVGGDGGELPPTKAVVSAEDTKFDVERVRPGKNRVTFVNAGQEMHHAIFHRVPPGRSYQQEAKRIYGDERFGGWPPIDVPGTLATTVMDAGGIQVTELEFERGRYLVACYVSDRKGGPPHFATTLGGFEVR